MASDRDLRGLAAIVSHKLHVSSRTAAVTRAFPDRPSQRLRQCGRAGPPLHVDLLACGVVTAADQG